MDFIYNIYILFSQLLCNELSKNDEFSLCEIEIGIGSGKALSIVHSEISMDK